MRHYDAIQVEGGKWFYCQTTGRGGIPTGNCSANGLCPGCQGQSAWISSVVCDVCKGKGLVPKEKPCQGHDTKEEAYEHQRQYELDQATYQIETSAVRERSNQLHRCEAPGCGEFTCGYAQVPASYQYHVLCPNHCNRATLATLLRVGERWQS